MKFVCGFGDYCIMSLAEIEDIVISSGEKVQTTGFYEPLDHDDGCKIMDDENNLFLDKGSEAPKMLSCQHDIVWRLKSSE